MAKVFGTQFNITTGDAFLPLKWSKDLTIAREEVLKLGKAVNRINADSCDSIQVPNLANLAAPNTVTSDGDTTNVTPATDSYITLLLNQSPVYKLNIPDELSLKTQYNLAEEWKKKAAFGIGLSIEDYLFGLWSSFTTNVIGDANTDVTPNRLLRAVQKLNEANAPESDRSGFFRPSQFTAMLDTPRFVETNSMGYGPSDSPTRTAQFKQAYGVRLDWSNRVVVSAGTAENMVFQKDAILMGVLRDVKVEEFARTDFARNFGASSFYGAIMRRNDHMVIVQTAQ